jgi:cytochrome bd-type quinol oxidase subunit 1
MAIVVPLMIAALAAPIEILIGDWAARTVHEAQPTKLAAIEGVAKTTGGALLHGLGWYDDGKLRHGVRVPKLLSTLASHDPSARVQGLDVVPPGDRPPVNIVRVAFQTMVGIGTLLGALGVLTLLVRVRRRRLPTRRAYYAAVAAAGPLSLVALVASWVTTEVGRLCDDAQRRGEHDLVAPYRRRALGAGAVAGLLAVAGLGVLHRDAHPLYRDLVAGPGFPAVIVSGVAGVAALTLVLRRRFKLARYAAALAVAAIVAGWALAQQPWLLPGLTVDQAAAPTSTLIAIVIAVAGGGIVVVPSLFLLLRLSIAGRLGYGSHSDDRDTAAESSDDRAAGLTLDPARAGGLATACLIGGFGFLTVAEVGWAHAIGVTMLLAAIALGLAAAAPALLEDDESDGSSRSRAT